jgi:hypothetical protein
MLVKARVPSDGGLCFLWKPGTCECGDHADLMVLRRCGHGRCLSCHAGNTKSWIERFPGTEVRRPVMVDGLGWVVIWFTIVWEG